VSWTLNLNSQIISSFLLHLAKDSCTPSPKKGKRVVGGAVVDGRKYPWAGACFYKNEFQCGGNLGKFFTVKKIA
jgi:hypothetical protein